MYINIYIHTHTPQGPAPPPGPADGPRPNGGSGGPLQCRRPHPLQAPRTVAKGSESATTSV